MKPSARAVAPSHRGHSLAPEHLGERGAAATLVAGIGGVALSIAAGAMTVGGLTVPNRYAGATPPPNVSQLGMGQVFGGIGLLVLGILIVGSSAALIVGLPRSRGAAAGVSTMTALLAAAAFAVLVPAQRRDTVLLAALGISFVAYAGVAFVLARLKQ
jgi:hypothetical protein